MECISENHDFESHVRLALHFKPKKSWGRFDASDFASHFVINLEEKVSEAADEGKMLNLRWSCSRVEVDTRYKVASDGAWIWSTANNHIQVCMLQCHFLRTHRLCYTILTSDLLAQFGSASERKSKGQGFESHVELALNLKPGKH